VSVCILVFFEQSDFCTYEETSEITGEEPEIGEDGKIYLPERQEQYCLGEEIVQDEEEEQECPPLIELGQQVPISVSSVRVLSPSSVESRGYFLEVNYEHDEKAMKPGQAVIIKEVFEVFFRSSTKDFV